MLLLLLLVAISKIAQTRRIQQIQIRNVHSQHQQPRMGNTGAKAVGETVKREYPRVAQAVVLQQAQAEQAALLAQRAASKATATAAAAQLDTADAAKPLVANMNQLIVNTVPQKQVRVWTERFAILISKKTTCADLCRPVPTCWHTHSNFLIVDCYCYHGQAAFESTGKQEPSIHALDAPSRRALPSARDRAAFEEAEHVLGRLSIEQARAIFKLRRGTIQSAPARNETLPAGATAVPLGSASATAAGGGGGGGGQAEKKAAKDENAMHYLATEDTDPLEAQQIAQALWSPNRVASQFKLPVDDVRLVLAFFNDAVITETARGKKYGTWEPYPKELRHG